MILPLLVAVLAAAARPAAGPVAADPFDRQAVVLYRRGEWDRLLALANERLRTAAPDDPMRDDYYLTRGEAYSELHDAALAREALDRALPLAEAAHHDLILAKIHRHRGLVLWRYDRNLDAAEREYEVALEYAQRVGDGPEIVNVLIVAANPYRDEARRDLPRALRLYLRALDIVRQQALFGWLPILLKNVGDVYRQQGDLDAAERTLTEAMGRADAAGATEQRWATRLELGMIARARGHAAEAEQYYLQALEILDEKQSSVLLEELRAGALAGSLLFANPYDEYIDFLIAQGRSADAFLVAERQRARVFLDTLSGARESLAEALPAGFAGQERALLGAITRAQAELRAGEASDARRAELLAAIGRSETAMEDLRLRLAVDRPALAHARYPRLSTVESLQRTVVGVDEALVSVYLGAHHSVAWIVSRDRLITIALPSHATIDPLVRSALSALRDPAGDDPRALSALSRALRIDELLTASRRPRLIVVPSGPLYDLPFEALLDGSGHPILERVAISYAPSASVLAFLRSEPAVAAGETPLLTVANPIVSPSRAGSTRPADLGHLDLLTPVPSTAEEAHVIARLFGAGASVLEGSRATRAELERSGAGHARILHFATHGLIDEERPERSGLVLTADPPRDDGLLQMRQIYGLHLDAQLVTLSACETALGQNVTGEGVIGLTRAFFYAGARSVVASLWDVEDQATARLMEAFYARLRAGEPIDEALRHAKLTLLRGAGPAARPFYWAAFVASGDARGSVVDSRHIDDAGIWLSFAAACAGLTGGMLALAYRRRQRMSAASASVS
jgi:CHAT domain-containing protein